MSRMLLVWTLSASLLTVSLCRSDDFNIVIDYSEDTTGFFALQSRRDALQAVANRWSSIINSSLTAVGPGGTGTGTSAGWRIGFSHPGTGASYQISTAANSGSDPLIGGGAADVYGFGGLAANEWRLYAGGRNLGGTAGVGGTGTGLNFTSTFDDLQGPMHRGVISNTLANTANDIPAWGGSISFNNTLTWHFDPATSAPLASTDFYSIAMHEIGHALGLSVSFNQWTNFQVGSTFTGPKAVAAFNQDNGTSVTSLNLVSSTNRHWQDNTQLSRIFPVGSPNYVGTVGAGTLQDLLMDPTANFTVAIRRLEATNVDIGALMDLGWSTVAIPEVSSIFYVLALLVVMGYCYSRRAGKAQKEQQPAAEEMVPVPAPQA